MAVAIAFGSQGSATSSSGSATISGLSFNAEASDRIIAVTIAVEQGTGSSDITAVTIGGVSATERIARNNSERMAEIWDAAVPTGTSGSVVVTITGNATTVSVATFSVTGADATPTDTDGATGTGASLSITALTVPTDGAGIAGYINAAFTGSTAWTGAAESHDTDAGNFIHSSAIVASVGTNTVTADSADSQSQALVGVAWGPAAGGVNEDRTASADGVATTSATAALFADVTGSAAGSCSTSATGDNGIFGGSLALGGGRITRQRRKTLPYGWWAEVDKPAQEIEQAERAVAEARAEVKASGEVQPGTLAQLDTALWFADVETKLTALEAAASKRKRQAELTAIAAEIAKAKAEYERALEEQDEEEAIALLFTNTI